MSLITRSAASGVEADAENFATSFEKFNHLEFHKDNVIVTPAGPEKMKQAFAEIQLTAAQVVERRWATERTRLLLAAQAITVLRALRTANLAVCDLNLNDIRVLTAGEATRAAFEAGEAVSVGLIGSGATLDPIQKRETQRSWSLMPDAVRLIRVQDVVDLTASRPDGPGACSSRGYGVGPVGRLFWANKFFHSRAKPFGAMVIDTLVNRELPGCKDLYHGCPATPALADDLLLKDSVVAKVVGKVQRKALKADMLIETMLLELQRSDAVLRCSGSTSLAAGEGSVGAGGCRQADEDQILAEAEKLLSKALRVAEKEIGKGVSPLAAKVHAAAGEKVAKKSKKSSLRRRLKVQPHAMKLTVV